MKKLYTPEEIEEAVLALVYSCHPKEAGRELGRIIGCMDKYDFIDFIEEVNEGWCDENE